MEEVEYEGLKDDEPSNNEVKQNGHQGEVNGFYGYNYDDFTSGANIGSDSQVEHGVLSESNSGFVTLISSLVLSIDSFKHDGITHTFLPLCSLILSGLVLLKTEYNSLPIATYVPNEHVDSLKTALGVVEVVNLVFLTTSSKYVYVSTGYISIWISFLCSTNLCAYSIPYVQQVEETLKRYHSKSSLLFYIFCLSFTMLSSTLLSCFMMSSDEGMCSTNAMIGVISSLASTAVAGWLLASDYSVHTVSINGDTNSEQQDVLLLASKIFVVLWLYVVAFLTTSEPYFDRYQGSVVGNVFFPSWGCLLLAAYLYQNLSNIRGDTQENSFV